MKVATYTLRGGKKFTVQYDPNSPCRLCGLPVVAASVSGIDICPWCDLGCNRDGTMRFIPNQHSPTDRMKYRIEKAIYLDLIHTLSNNKDPAALAIIQSTISCFS